MPPKSPHSLCIPIYNLRISDDIGGELQVGDVTFISARKLPRIRRRLGIPDRISDLQRRNALLTPRDFFSLAETYAHLKTTRGERDSLNHEFHRIRQAVFLLASSQFYRVRRSRRIFFGSPEYNTLLRDQYLLVNITSESAWIHLEQVSSNEPYTLDRQWQDFLRRHFFPKLLRTLNSPVKLSKWSYCIRDAALCAGQSHWARTRWEALLYDMIGIETLLTHRGETQRDALIERVNALLGWFIPEDDPTPWKDKIEKLYRLRNNIVHEANVRGVTMQDIMNADMILGNLLYNICALPKIFDSKEAIIKLAERMKAYGVLGMRPRRPKQLRFVKPYITQAERMSLENDRHWAW